MEMIYNRLDGLRRVSEENVGYQNLFPRLFETTSYLEHLLSMHVPINLDPNLDCSQYQTLLVYMEILYLKTALITKGVYIDGIDTQFLIVCSFSLCNRPIFITLFQNIPTHSQRIIHTSLLVTKISVIEVFCAKTTIGQRL